MTRFQNLWKEYEQRINNLQQWMTMVEKQVNDGTLEQSRHLLTSQFKIHSRSQEKEAKCFANAMEIVKLSDESLQRSRNAQFEKRWKKIEHILENDSEIKSDTILPGTVKLTLHKARKLP